MMWAVAMPRTARVSAQDGVRVELRWRSGPRAGSIDRLDLSPLVNSCKLYRPLRKDRELFASARTTEGGHAIAWGDGGREMCATALERLTDELGQGGCRLSPPARPQ